MHAILFHIRFAETEDPAPPQVCKEKPKEEESRQIKEKGGIKGWPDIFLPMLLGHGQPKDSTPQ